MYKKSFQNLYAIARNRIPEPAEVTMRLQRLEKPEAWPGDLLEKVWGTVPANLLQRYPDFVPFYRKLAAFAGVGEDALVVGSGIDEFIKTLMTLCCDPGDAAAVTWPGYAMYDVYAKIFSLDLVRLIPDPRRKMTAADMIARLTPKVRVFFLPNPGQPVENCLELDELRVLAAACRDREIPLAVDEAYFHFGGPTAMPLIREFDNVLVLRTFSKAFGAASLRVGFAAGAPRAIKPVSAFRMAGEVNAPAMHAASVMIDHFESHVAPSIAGVCAGRDFLRDAVAAECGFETWGRLTNCVLIDLQTETRMKQVIAGLKRRGIYVKGEFPDPFRPYILTTCGSRALMEQFFDHFKAVAGKAA
jgi:histidinol-phosphate/aromatic aminotransferase/cobyric acid decarboxylase-like protein